MGGTEGGVREKGGTGCYGRVFCSFYCLSMREQVKYTCYSVMEMFSSCQWAIWWWNELRTGRASTSNESAGDGPLICTGRGTMPEGQCHSAAKVR